MPNAERTTVIVVPCHNEAARLDLAAFRRFLSNSHDVKLLFVDDGSQDDTAQKLERLRLSCPKQVNLLRLAENAGKAEAVRRGIVASLRMNPLYVGYWDADLATPLDSVIRFREALQSNPQLALVMGSRVALLGRRIRRKWTRHMLGRAFATAASVVLGLSVYDTQCGAKLFRVNPAMRTIFAAPFGTRWVFDVEILARLKWLALAAESYAMDELICEYPLERWTDVPGSRLKLRDFFVASFDLFGIAWQYRMRGTQKKAASTFEQLNHEADALGPAQRSAA